MPYKALIITANGFQDHEVIYPYYRLKGAGFSVSIVADARDAKGRCYGLLGSNMPCDVLCSDIGTQSATLLEECQILVVPGGVKALEKLRIDRNVVEFVSDWDKTGKLIASTCSGAQLLITARVVSGKVVSGYYAMEADISNAGAEYSPEPVVVSHNIVSSPHYDFLGEWMEATLAEFERRSVS